MVGSLHHYTGYPRSVVHLASALNTHSKSCLQVFAILLSHSEIHKVEIQGHTDDQGDEAYNLDLSQRRVESVRQLLIVQGVEANRLEARGYGESKPISEGQTDEARAANRRVQFLIVETGE